jgi:hypothetical protein
MKAKTNKEILDNAMKAPEYNLTDLEMALLYNLCIYEGNEGWKSRAQIIKTDAKVKKDNMPEPPLDHKFRSSNLPRYMTYTSPVSTLGNILEKLEKKNVVEKQWISYKDKPGYRTFKKRAWRLVRTSEAYFKIHTLVSLYDRRLEQKFGVLNTQMSLRWFNHTPYFEELNNTQGVKGTLKKIGAEVSSEIKKGMIVRYREAITGALISHQQLESIGERRNLVQDIQNLKKEMEMKRS